MTFSESAGIKLSGGEEWFDPCIVLDSPLCVDPFLMLDFEKNDEFKDAHAEIVAFFQHQFRRVAEAGPSTNSPAMRDVVRTMHMPEAEEVCLGYSTSTRGLGSGRILAELMVQGMMDSIAVGLTELTHFEEISILGSGIGPDRISDAAIGLTKWRFAKYTERICKELGVKTQRGVLDRARYDSEKDRWVSIEAVLPINPRNRKPVLLIPQVFLRHLPTLGSEEFEQFAWREWRDEHKNDLERAIVSQSERERILEQARKDPEVRARFIKHAESVGGTPYDFERDVWGVNLAPAVRHFVSEAPFRFSAPSDAKQMKTFVMELAKYFKHYVEEQGGWELLWDHARPKPEKAVQRLFLAVVFLTCATNDVSVDPEANIGRGPVDFKFSRGFTSKCLLETKLASNTKWINSVVTQLPTYVIADVGKYGVYVLVKHNDSKKKNIETLEEAAALVLKKGIEIEVLVVDAGRDKPSASKIR